MNNIFHQYTNLPTDIINIIESYTFCNCNNNKNNKLIKIRHNRCFYCHQMSATLLNYKKIVCTNCYNLIYNKGKKINCKVCHDCMFDKNVSIKKCLDCDILFYSILYSYRR